MDLDRFGHGNSAYYFDGIDDTINIIHNGKLTFNSEDNFSISLWFKLSSYKDEVILSHKDFTRNGIIISTLYGATLPDSLKKKLYISLEGDIDGVNPTLYSHDTLLLNKWYHLTLLYNGASDYANLYLNGYLQYSIKLPANLTGDLGKSDIPVSFGKRIGEYTNNYFNGLIDDIRFYSNVLTEKEILSLYNEGLCYQVITVTDTLIINVNITGFNPVKYSNIIKVYPNPTNDHITINYGNYLNWKGYTVKIFNSQGKTVFTNKITQQQSYVDLSTWTGKGIYFVHIIDGLNNTIEIKKIILQ